MKPLDLIIIFGYLIGIVVFGTWFGRKQETTKDYFLGDRSVPWWAVAFSIVATETSTITSFPFPESLSRVAGISSSSSLSLATFLVASSFLCCLFLHTSAAS
jgi:Na+/proline symporter